MNRGIERLLKAVDPRRLRRSTDIVIREEDLMPAQPAASSDLGITIDPVEEAPDESFHGLIPVYDRSTSIGWQISDNIRDEVRRWESARPDIMFGDRFIHWIQWSTSIFGEGLEALRTQGQEMEHHPQSVMNSIFIKYALVLTQEGYVYERQPESRALASALNAQITVDLDNRIYLDDASMRQDALRQAVQGSRLVGWLLENDRQYQHQPNQPAVNPRLHPEGGLR